jgi:hypothetical protein
MILLAAEAHLLQHAGGFLRKLLISRIAVTAVAKS